MLQILGEANRTTRTKGGLEDEGIPKGVSMKTLKVYGGQDVIHVDRHYFEIGKEFHLPVADRSN